MCRRPLDHSDGPSRFAGKVDVVLTWSLCQKRKQMETPCANSFIQCIANSPGDATKKIKNNRGADSPKRASKNDALMGNHLSACFGTPLGNASTVRQSDNEKKEVGLVVLDRAGRPSLRSRYEHGHGKAADLRKCRGGVGLEGVGYAREHQKCLEWVHAFAAANSVPNLQVGLTTLSSSSSHASSLCLDPVSPLAATRRVNGLPIEDDQEWIVGSFSEVELLHRMLVNVRASAGEGEGGGSQARRSEVGEGNVGGDEERVLGGGGGEASGRGGG